MKWLVTGGCGLIGRALISELLVSRDRQVRVIDSLSVSTRAQLGAVAPVSDPHDGSDRSMPLALMEGDIRDAEAAGLSCTGGRYRGAFLRERSVKVSLGRLAPRARAVHHKAYVRAFSGLAPYYLINEFPKSGGTWLTQMLADALDLPFRRNVPIRFEPALTHGHFLSPFGLRNVVVLWRDPRDVIVSYYYHCYFRNEHRNTALVRLMKERCPFGDYADIRANLPAFIRFLSQTPVSPSFTWPAFAAVWAGRQGTIQTSYEALRADTPGELVRVAEALTETPLPAGRAAAVAERHSFTRVKQAAERAKPPHAELSFVREGALGGWRRHFTPDAVAALREGGYEAGMRKLGYATEHATGEVE